MKKQHIIVLLLAIAAVGVYLWLDSASNMDQPVDLDTSAADTVMDGDSDSSDYIGLSVEEAERLAEEREELFRVVEIDGEPQMVTEDYRPGRINAVTADGVVTRYEVEGAVDMVTPEAGEAGMHDEIIGMTEEDALSYAEENDIRFRIGARDGVFLPVTMDSIPGRITASIEDGVVASYTVE